MLERVDSNKHSNLFGLFVSYNQNEVLWIQSQMTLSKIKCWLHFLKCAVPLYSVSPLHRNSLAYKKSVKILQKSLIGLAHFLITAESFRMAEEGNTKWEERLSTLDFLIMEACFVKM
jgi:hypothetical protein